MSKLIVYLLIIIFSGMGCVPEKTSDKQDLVKTIPAKKEVKSDEAPKEIEAKSDDSYRIAFYNVENLFDTVDNPQTNDKDFLPGEKLDWTDSKLQQKINKLSKVIKQLGNGALPEILGLCEVENKKVVEALFNYCCKDQYGIVHKDSPDERGIDVALVYDKSKVKIIDQEFLTLDLDGDFTRDILYAKAKINEEIIHLFFNHWPSRRNPANEFKREAAAALLRKKTEEIFANNKVANIVIMGDFNDEPHNSSIKKVLKAEKLPEENIVNTKLYNLTYTWSDKGEGSYFYDKWNAIDQIIVSGAIMDDSGCKISAQDAKVLKEDWMIFHDKKNDVYKPNKFMNGGTGRVYGGYSDHLPIYVDVRNN